MREQCPNQEYPVDVLVNLADMDQSLTLAECERYGLEQGWNDHYLSGVRESSQLFEHFQSLVLRERSLTMGMQKLEEIRHKALHVAENTADNKKAESFRQVVKQYNQAIKLKKQEAQDLKDQINDARQAYEQSARSTMESFNFPAA